MSKGLFAKLNELKGKGEKKAKATNKAVKKEVDKEVK